MAESLNTKNHVCLSGDKYHNLDDVKGWLHSLCESNKKEGERIYTDEERNIKPYRVGNIEFRYCNGNGCFEVVKWYPNDLFGKKNEYKLIDGEKDRYIKKGKENSPIKFIVPESSFSKPEYCYVIAFIRKKEKDGLFKIDFVEADFTEDSPEGSSYRVQELCEKDFEDFKAVLKKIRCFLRPILSIFDYPEESPRRG